MAGNKTETSIDVLVDIQHGKFGIDHDDSFETWGDAARFLQGITDALAAKAGSELRPLPGFPYPDRIVDCVSAPESILRQEAIADAAHELEMARYGDPDACIPFTAQEATRDDSEVLEPGEVGPLSDCLGTGTVGLGYYLPPSECATTEQLADGGGETMVEAPALVTEQVTEPQATTSAPVCAKCGQPKVKGNRQWYCQPCWKTKRSGPEQAAKLAQARQKRTASPQPQSPVIAPPVPRQTIEAPAVSSIDTAAQTGSRPMLLTEPPVTFPWSDRNFRAALSVLNSPAAARAKRIVITKRVGSYKAVTEANMRTGDEPVASFHLTNGCWYGMAENHPTAEYLIPEAWYVSKN